jgi:hypothetical protein
LKKNISQVKGALKILSDMNFPKEITHWKGEPIVHRPSQTPTSPPTHQDNSFCEKNKSHVIV